jgi:hypothetical protein
MQSSEEFRQCLRALGVDPDRLYKTLADESDALSARVVAFLEPSCARIQQAGDSKGALPAQLTPTSGSVLRCGSH